MKRLFSILLLFFVNVAAFFFIRWENVLMPAFLSPSFPLSAYYSVSFKSLSLYLQISILLHFIPFCLPL